MHLRPRRRPIRDRPAPPERQDPWGFSQPRKNRTTPRRRAA